MTKATVNYRQEKTHMMSAVDRSFTDQSTLQEDERLGLSFMDAHGYSPRGECLSLPCGPQALLLSQQPTDNSVNPELKWKPLLGPAEYQHWHREGTRVTFVLEELEES